MLKDWDNAIITDINVAIYVAPGGGKAIHQNRPFHGFVINDDTSDKNIHFSEGFTLHAGPNEVHYLPKGSSYRVESIIPGGCWAINFSLLEDIVQPPFSLRFRNSDAITKAFKDATDAWKSQAPGCNALIRKSLYDIIARCQKELHRSYMPGQKELLLQPALDAISRDYTRNDLSVKALADLCQISEAYFRRLFKEKFSVSPRQYIIALRMEYAKRLLQSNQMSVSEVAEMCGYLEPCHFSREFTRHTSVSPKAFSKNHTDR